VRSCTTSSLLQSTPGEGKAGRKEEEVRASGGVDPLGCWVPSLLLSPLSRVGGGVCSEPGWCQGVTTRYRRRGWHTMIVNSERWWLLTAKNIDKIKKSSVFLKNTQQHNGKGVGVFKIH
jgi:hypothetical protein